MFTARIDLGDGDYCELIRDLMHRTYRAVRDYCAPMIAKGNLEKELEAPIHEDNLFELYFMNQALTIKIGELEYHRPFEIKTLRDLIDNCAQEKYIKLQTEMNRLYTPSPLAVSPSPSKPS